MKNQYFGDVRDLFKYDLIQRILKEISSLQRFTFIPMLTENEPESTEGNKRNFNWAKEHGRPGTKNEKLIKTLRKYGKIDRDKRDFTEIEKYFKSSGFEILIYKGQGNKDLDSRMRDEYFKNIPEEFLHKSLVFVDPDIGLEIKNSTEKHLLYREVKGLYDRMDQDSILMIYQHFPREDHKEYLSRRSNVLKGQTKDLPIYISDNEIIFFLLTKNDELKSQLGRIVDRYKRDCPNLIIGNANYNGI